ncbi:MAG: PEGA domain-containing protein [Cryomorphaceae bacterium]|nr:PEGA domain-containing protein [Cryomorphaceae bacterium]
MNHFYFLLCFLLSSQVFGQLKEFHITERESDGTSVVQGNTTYPDNAMVLVYSVLPNLDFRSSVGGVNQVRYNERASRYEVLISPQKQILFVSSPGYIEQRIGLLNPNPKQVYYFQVEERVKQDEISVFFLVQPEDAQLYLDNIPYEINTTIRAPKGTVDVRIERQGYRSVEETISISESRIKYDYNMVEVDVAPVQIKGNVPQAKVIIDTNERGSLDKSGSFALFLYPGIYTVALQKGGYLSQTKTLEVMENETNTLEFNLTKNSGFVNFDISPSHARIEINKEQHLGGNKAELVPGRYRIDVSADGYHSYSESVDIRRGETVDLKKELVQMVGGLQFSVSPTEAKVQLKNSDGKVVERWVGLKLINDLPVGTYTLQVSSDGYVEQEHRLVIIEGKRESLNVTLSESQTKVKTPRIRSVNDDGGTHQFLHLTMMPSNSSEGTMMRNSNYGFRYTNVKKHGFFVDFNMALNFSSHDFVMENNAIQSDDFPDGLVQFSPTSNIKSFSIGGGYIQKINGNFYVSAGMSFYNYQLRQEAEYLELDGILAGGEFRQVLVKHEDAGFSGIVFNAGVLYALDNFSMGLNLGNFYPSKVSVQFMLGVKF